MEWISGSTYQIRLSADRRSIRGPGRVPLEESLNTGLRLLDGLVVGKEEPRYEVYI